MRASFSVLKFLGAEPFATTQRFVCRFLCAVLFTRLQGIWRPEDLTQGKPAAAKDMRWADCFTWFGLKLKVYIKG